MEHLSLKSSKGANLLNPTLIILAGVNGAGKTSYAKTFIERESLSPDIINPDEIGYRESLKLALTYIKERRDFIRETTLTGIKIIDFIDFAKRNSYEIVLIYIYVNDYEICIKRVADRVKLGGHDVPTKDIIRRFTTSRDNLIKILPKVDRGIILDASTNDPDNNRNSVIIAEIRNGILLMKSDSSEYDWINKNVLLV